MPIIDPVNLSTKASFQPTAFTLTPTMKVAIAALALLSAAIVGAATAGLIISGLIVPLTITLIVCGVLGTAFTATILKTTSIFTDQTDLEAKEDFYVTTNMLAIIELNKTYVYEPLNKSLIDFSTADTNIEKEECYKKIAAAYKSLLDQIGDANTRSKLTYQASAKEDLKIDEF